MYKVSDQDSKKSLQCKKVFFFKFGHDPASLRARCRKVTSPGFLHGPIKISSKEYWISLIYLSLFILK